LVKRLDPVSMQPHHDYVLVGRRDALTRDFAIMLDDLRTAFTKRTRQAPKGRGARTDRSGSGPAPAASRNPD
jgi:ribonuclease P protein component